MSTTPERELIITSAVIAQPGDKVLLLCPEGTPLDEMSRVLDRLKQWAPGVEWLLVASVQAVGVPHQEETP